jgi:hypothetical protein
VAGASFGGAVMTIAVGDVDGDHRDDLVIGTTAGVQVFSHLTDLGTPLPAPTFRAPGTGFYTGVVLGDVDGDGRGDLVIAADDTATVWIATGHGTFTAARTITPVFAVVAAGDTDRDGRDDVVIRDDVDASSLYLGCRSRELGCDGGLQAAPAWTTPVPVIAMVPDINHDGRSEAIATGESPTIGTELGHVSLYLSDRRTGLAATPAWSMIGDPNYLVFGRSIVAPGDLDGDGKRNEFVMTSAGRMYAFFPQLHDLASLQPAVAWPPHDRAQDQIDAGDFTFSSGTQVVAAAGDIDRDGYDDVIVGDVEAFGETAGRVEIFGGGRLAKRAPSPYLPGAPVCHPPATGKPDLTVDGGAMARSLFVAHASFEADACVIAEGCVNAPGDRKLLKFTTAIGNYGGSAAVIPGPDTAPELYHENCDGDLELSDFAVFELLDPTGTTVTVGRKQSFFLVDVNPVCLGGAPETVYFPDRGVSPGWADVYTADVDCQWLDVTDVPDGRYTLRVTVDTQHLVDQDDVLPDTASVDIELAGDRVSTIGEAGR